MTYIIIGAIILIFIAGIAVKQQPTGEKYSASFGDASFSMSIFNKGFSLAGGMKAITRDQSFRNCLIVGATGSNKTAGPLTGSLFTLSRSPSSIVVLDVSSENKLHSSGYLHAKKGRKIYSLDFGPNSDGFNPLAWCKNADDLNRVAHVLLKNAEVTSKNDPYWSSSSEMILALFLQLLVNYEREEHRNMANVVLLLETYMSEPEKIDLLFVRTKDENLLRSYKTLNAIPEKTRQSILSTAITATKLFKSPAVARCTSINTFDVASFRKEPSVLYICIPLNQVSFLAPLSALLFEMMFQESLSEIPKKSALPIFYLMDEMITMKLDLGLVFSNCRKYKVGCMGVIQDLKMLEMKYSQAESYAIKSNACSQVYLPPQSLPTCKELQEILGKCIVKDERGNERQQYLMEASEIRTMSEAIILINGGLPLRERIRPYYKHFIYNSRTKIPPYVATQRKIPFDTPSFIELPS